MALRNATYFGMVLFGVNGLSEEVCYQFVLTAGAETYESYAARAKSDVVALFGLPRWAAISRDEYLMSMFEKPKARILSLTPAGPPISCSSLSLRCCRCAQSKTPATLQ